MALRRIPTGIEGFDELIEGGIPEGFSVLLSGPIGSHKLLFALEFLYRGAEKGENVIFVSFEKDKNDVIEIASVFDWKMGEMIKSKRFVVYKTELFNVEKFAASLEDTVFNYKATRLVLDSTSFIGQFLDSPFKLRTALGELKKVLYKDKCTSLFLCETDGNKISQFGVEENAVDGVIQSLVIEEPNNVIHGICVRSMHSTDFNMQKHPVDITKHGLKVHRIPIVD
ncbi:MAG: hypothetical protein J7K68_02470 [Candidatus Diapherotrites archaeon]|nr:hypothetical protein [Candidatus Diapherotrites archaeon]